MILLVINSPSTCFGRLYAHRQEVRLRFHCLSFSVLLWLLWCWRVGWQAVCTVWSSLPDLQPTPHSATLQHHNTAYVFLSYCDCCDVGESDGKLCALCGVGCLPQATYSTQCTKLASRLSNITTGQITICSEKAVWPPEDGRKDARNMLRNNWLTIKSLIVASCWLHIYLRSWNCLHRSLTQPWT